MYVWCLCVFLVQEITIKGENELDTAQHERRHLQQKVTNILAKLTAEEAKHVAAANEAHNLAGNVLILTQENVALGEQLRVQEVKIREVLEAYQQREKVTFCLCFFSRHS